MNSPRLRDTPRGLLWTRWTGALIALAFLVWIRSATLEPSRPENLQAVVLDMPELHCPIWCPVQIDRSLDGERGIFDLRVDATQGRVWANLDPEHTDPEQLIATLRAQGWKVDVAPRAER